VKELSEQTHYEILELSPGCSAEAVEIAYRKQKALLGPDSLATYALLGPVENRLMRARLDEAFAVLADTSRRHDYDRGLGFPSPMTDGIASPASSVTAPPPRDEPAVVAAPPPPPPSPPAPPLASAEPLRDDAEKPVRRAEADLPLDAVVTGEALRRIREALGYSLKDLAARTKIGHWHLENIERERYADLPAQVYLRGFLTSLARELKLDPQRVAKGYLEQLAARSKAVKPP
jgi:curved DNA-binding protein CbpA